MTSFILGLQTRVPSRRLRHASLLRVAFAVAVLTSLACGAHAETDATQGKLITSLAVAVNPSTHKVYAVNGVAGTVSVINELPGAAHVVRVGEDPVSLAVNRVTNRIYVVNANSDSVSVIDGKRDAVIATIQIGKGSYPYAVAVDDAANVAYVTSTYSNALTVIDGATNDAHTLKTGSADGIAVDPRTHAIFLTTYEDPNVRIVNPTTGAVSKVAVGPHLWGIVFDPTLDTVFLAHTLTNNIVALDEKTHAVITVPAGSIPCALGVNPDTQKLYAVNYGDRTVSVIDARTLKVLATLPVGAHPQAIVVDSLHNRIYVANVHGNSVTAINGASNSLLGTYRAGKNPYALAVDPETGRLFAADYGPPTVTEVAVPLRPRRLSTH